jgi:pyrroline-5-carboxylate reductase
VVVSIAAGVRAGEISAAFGGRPVARVMPITAVAIGKGVASIFATDPVAAERARALVGPVAGCAELATEDLIDVATAVSGSSPAYLYAMTEALEAAGARAGLPIETSRTLARATVAGAAALMAETGTDPAELRRQVTSPAGTTAAALEVLMGDNGFGPLLDAAVQAAVARARELGR